jgi:hypothetical protein
MFRLIFVAGDRKRYIYEKEETRGAVPRQRKL